MWFTYQSDSQANCISDQQRIANGIRLAREHLAPHLRRVDLQGRCDGVPQGEPNSPQLCSGSCILWQTAFATCFEACASCWEDGEIAGATCIDNASGFVAEGGRNFRSSRESLGNLRCWGGCTCFKACTGFLYEAFDMSSFRTR